MQAFMKLAFGFLGMNPFALGAISAAVFGLGAYLQVEENRTNIEKADALLAGPPPAVRMIGIKEAAAAHPFSEVTVQAQLDMAMEYELVLTSDKAERIAYMVPLLSAEATVAEQADVLAVLLIDEPDLSSEAVAAIDFGPRAEAEGPFGPILMLNGMVGGMGDFDNAISEVFAQEWRDLPVDVPVLRSFETTGARADAYGPDWPFETSIFGLFAWVGGAIGIYALFRSAVHFRPLRNAGEAEITEDEEETLSKVMAAV